VFRSGFSAAGYSDLHSKVDSATVSCRSMQLASAVCRSVDLDRPNFAR